MKNTNSHYMGLGDILFFETNKYFIEIYLVYNIFKKEDLLYKIEKFNVVRKTNLIKEEWYRWRKKSLKIFFSFEPNIVSKIFPHVEDLLKYSKWMSDKKINSAIERLLKLKAFS